jgi:asparagine synthase (glutamine-hydrolysing)
MCGICGKVAFDPDASVEPRLVSRMMRALRHRGPDGEGSYVAGSIGLGHTRLSIIDLCTGEQPIANEDGRVVVVFNGEIYNYKELRRLLEGEGHRFRTTSDTEVIVHAYEQYGDACVSELQGMFAFALWDANARRLLLARDRVGIKPLYYAVTRSGVVFGSELKAVLCDQDVLRTVNHQGVDLFLTMMFMPGRHTLLNGVVKLEPGNILIVQDGTTHIRPYWDLEIPDERRSVNVQESVSELRELLRKTVRRHLISDVPVGVLLSGGVDSAGVLAMAAAESQEPLHTFTIGFNQPNIADERLHARQVARRFNSRHFETTISADEFRSFLPRYVWHMEEPVCEPPAIALYFVSKLAAEHVKVLLSGEGGDEAFAGYSNYRTLMWVEWLKKFMPAAAASAVAHTLGVLPAQSSVRRYATALEKPIAEYYLSRRAVPGAGLNGSKAKLYTPQFQRHVSDMAGPLVAELVARVSGRDALSQMLYVDTKTWLPDDLLVKADKMTMATSVELRVPLLDHHVLEFAAALPSNLKIRRMVTKFILKEALRDLVPAHILDKRKTGFPVPYASWLRGDLRNYVADVLLDTRSIQRGYFRREEIERQVRSADVIAHASEIFSLLVVELWHRAFVDSVGVV